MTQSIQPNKLFTYLLHEDNVEKFSDPEHEPRGVQIKNIIPLNGGLNLGRVVFLLKDHSSPKNEKLEQQIIPEVLVIRF